MHRGGVRQRLSLDGQWQLAFDPGNRGRAEGWATGSFPAGATTVDVPSVWNVVRPGYEGVAFYRRRFGVPADWRGRRVRLLAEAANYYAELWINGQHAGAHEGGYTGFALDVTALLAYGAENVLVARLIDPPASGEVDGFRLAEVACAKETWYYRYGGIWGGVALEASGDVSCADLFVRPDPDGRPAASVAVRLANEGPAPVPLALRLLVAEPDGATHARAERALVLDTGEATVTLPVDLAGAGKWSPQQPRLYRCRCEVRRPGESALLDAVEVDFGLRTFDVAHGEFRLNGAPIVLKGVLYQPSYPRNLVYPPALDMAEQELRMIKDAGFNLVRFHVRPPHPRYLDLADRLGLLAYEETALAWIAPGPHLAERCRREVRETIERDRNHPSVVLWGIFNENQPAAHAVGAEMLSFARELDPTRPAIDNSGGTAALGQGSSWYGVTRVLPVTAREPVALNDLHLYFGAPVAPEVYYWLRCSGSPAPAGNPSKFGYATPAIVRSLRPRLARGGKLFVSELGYGGLPDLAAVVASFGRDTHLVDAAEARGYRDRLAEGLAARGLDGVLGGAAGAAGAAQALQARGDARQVEALRGNPRVSGYVVTQFNDAAWECHAGLVDLWRRPKLALAALAEANRSRRLILALPRYTFTPGEPVRVEATLVDDGLPLGALDAAHLQIDLSDGQGTRASSLAGLCDVGQPLSLATCTIASPRRPGEYSLRASLRHEGLEVATAEETITVLPAVDWPALREAPAGRVVLALPDERVTSVVGELPVGLAAEGQLLLASRPDALSRADWRTLLNRVHSGAQAILGPLTPDSARRLSSAGTMERPVEASGSIGCFMGWFHYLKSGPLFRDLPANGLAGEQYALVAPHHSLDELGGEVYAGVFTSGRQADGQPNFFWWADVQSLPLGRGRLLFCQYRIVERLGRDPVADLLLRNLLTFVAR